MPLPPKTVHTPSATSLQRTWNAKLHRAVPKALAHLQRHEGFLGFVANVDAMKFMQGKDVQKLLGEIPFRRIQQRLKHAGQLTIETSEDFAAALFFCFQNGKALELPCYHPRLFEWFEKHFGIDEKRMGGQAGIISNQLAALGSEPVCYCPILSATQAALFDKNVRFPLLQKGQLQLVQAKKAAHKKDPTKTNWIFEFSKGDQLQWQGKTITCPRSNRLIILSKLVKVEPLFSLELEPFLPQLARHFDRAMIAGFHHLHRKKSKTLRYYLERLCRQLDALKKANPRLRIHVEYVMIHDEKLAREVYEHIGRPADSLGINEVEMKHVLGMFGFKKELRALQKEENAFPLYQGARSLALHFNFERVHVHTLGYFIMYLSKKHMLPDPRAYIDSLLLAAKASEVRATLGKPPTKKDLLDKKFEKIKVSKIGLEQLGWFAKKAGLQGKRKTQFLEEGIADFGDHYVFVVPTPITPKPKSTVGLGDTISSTAFLSQP